MSRRREIVVRFVAGEVLDRWTKVVLVCVYVM